MATMIIWKMKFGKLKMKYWKLKDLADKFYALMEKLGLDDIEIDVALGSLLQLAEIVLGNHS
ncbi:hypothetical protein C5167_031770 [Papaver somniferum]|uniref:Uncharacterized protein n=1 Tax=Papaver somniferum TaxID=3469 RepID=A0A4Y7K598_PAPSO|nr:hypothetical protein C5167_031770 [Papaver somniferum]